MGVILFDVLVSWHKIYAGVVWQRLHGAQVKFPTSPVPEERKMNHSILDHQQTWPVTQRWAFIYFIFFMWLALSKAEHLCKSPICKPHISGSESQKIPWQYLMSNITDEPISTILEKEEAELQ